MALLVWIQLILSLFLGRHNVIKPGYRVSDLGEACPNVTRIISKGACRATVVSPEFFIHDPMGPGHDLPAGCIGDAVAPPHNPVVYWNPEGVAISNDPKLREICKDHSRTFECFCTRKHITIVCSTSKPILFHGVVIKRFIIYIYLQSCRNGYCYPESKHPLLWPPRQYRD